MPTVNPMAEFIGDLTSVATAVWTQVTKAAETITSTPLLVFTVGILLVGAPWVSLDVLSIAANLCVRRAK